MIRSIKGYLAAGMISGMVMAGTACAEIIDEPCDPNTGSGKCFMLEGRVTGSYIFSKAPQAYFPVPKGEIKAWLIGGSPGTWRLKIMKWSKVREEEKQNHFHEVAASPITPGPYQIASVKQEGNYDFYAFHVTCEDDCLGKPYTIFYESKGLGRP